MLTGRLALTTMAGVAQVPCPATVRRLAGSLLDASLSATIRSTAEVIGAWPLLTELVVA